MQTNVGTSQWSRLLLYLLASCALAGIFARLAVESSEARWRTIGGVWQLLGILSVAYGISQVRHSFGLPNTMVEIVHELWATLKAVGRRLGAILGRKPPPQAAMAGAAFTSAIAMSGRLTIRPGPSMTVEQRLGMLEQLVWGMEDALATQQDALKQERTERERALAAESVAPSEAAGRHERAFREFAVGGIRLQALGVAWLLVGVILSNWAPELSRHIPIGPR